MNAKALPLATLVAAAATLGAQSTPCFSANDANNLVSSATSSWSLSGPNVSAWRVTPATAIAVQSLRIYVGNAFGPSVGAFMGLAVWSDDPTTRLPRNELAHGTWTFQSANCWQGSNLDAVVVMQPNTDYWVALTEPGWSTLPIEPGGAAQPTAQYNGSIWSAGSSPQALKLRLYCGLLDDLHVVTRGAPCAASSGRLGSVSTNDTPRLGNAGFFVEGSGFPASTLAFLVVGVDPNWVGLSLPGADPACMIRTDPLSFLTGTTGNGGIRSNAPLGHVSYPFAVPNNPAITGLGVNAQIAAVDAASSFLLPLVTSNAVRLTLY